MEIGDSRQKPEMVLGNIINIFLFGIRIFKYLSKTLDDFGLLLLGTDGEKKRFLGIDYVHANS